MAHIKDKYAFLLDENVEKLADLFPKARWKTATEYGLKQCPDADVVRVAGDNGLIIVTNNTRDYTREMRRVAMLGDKTKHVCGLLTLAASSYEKQRELFPLVNISCRMKSASANPITWEYVTFANLWVHVKHKRDIVVSNLFPCACTSSKQRSLIKDY